MRQLFWGRWSMISGTVMVSVGLHQLEATVFGTGAPAVVMVLVESSHENQRKVLDPLRSAKARLQIALMIPAIMRAPVEEPEPLPDDG